MAKGEVRYRLTLDAKDFTSGIKVAQKEFEGFVGQLGSGAGSLGKVAAAMGPVGVAAAAAMGVATAGVGAFTKVTIDAAVAAVDFAGKISDLSTKTGISGEALQKLGFAGAYVGTSMESMAVAVSKMQQHMVKAPEDFKQLGLSLEYIKTLAPEKQFEAVGKAIQSIEDPAQRTAATVAFFGKSGQEAMKVLSVSMDETSEAAERLGIIMGDSTREALDDLGDSVTVLKTTWDHLLMNFGGAIAEMPEVKQAVDAITEALGEMSRFVLANKGDIQALVKIAIVPMADAVVDLFHAVQFLISGLVTLKNLVSGGWLEKMAKALLPKSSGSAGIGEGSGLSSSSRLMGDGKKAPTWTDPATLKKYEEELRKAQAAEDKFTAHVKDNAYQQFLGIQDVFNKRSKAQVKVLDDSLRREYEHADKLTKIGQQNAEVFAQMYKVAGAQVGAIFDEVAVGIGGVWGEMFHDLGTMTAKWVADNKAGLGDWIAGHQKAVQVAIAGIQAVFAAYQGGAASKSPGKGALGGAAKGAAAGLSFGVPGVIVGAFVGGIAGYLGGKKGQSAELKELNAELKRVQDEAKKAGVNLAVAFNPKNAQSLKTAIDEINKAMDTQAEATQALDDAMDRYGITVSELGPAFAQQKLDEQAGQLIKDWQILNAAGVDHLVLAEKLGPAFNEYVDTAVKAGAEIPQAMKPIIDDLYMQGKLVHENGEAYTEEEYKALKYGQTTTEMFQGLLKKIEELVNALLHIPNTSTTHTIHTVHTGDGGGGDDDGGGDDERNRGRTPLAGGFEGMVNRPRTFLVGENGPEYMSVRKPGDKGGFDMGSLEAKLDGLRDDFRRYSQAQGGIVRDAVLLGRA